jgi:hypothetical protein
MNHFELICEGVDVEPLAMLLDSRPDLWNTHRIRKESPGSPHAQMSDIWVRYNDVAPYESSGDYRRFNDVHVPIWYPAYDVLAPFVRPVIAELMARVEGEMLGGVLITKIPPGGRIAPHLDYGWHVEYYEKFYLSIQSAPGSIFGCDDGGIIEQLNPKTGEIWLFDNKKNHWVVNGSDIDRITMIICIRRMK